MILAGLSIGIYAFVLFFLGLLGMLSVDVVKITSVVLSLVLICLFFPKEFPRLKKFALKKETHYDTFSILLVIFLIAMAIVNCLGALGPELAFDALWYHLTFPKLYLLTNKILFIPGGLLYYSAVPKLAELLFTGSLAFGSEVFPKLISFSFGVLTMMMTYKFSRLFVSRKLSLLSCVIFYENLVVAWESITAYSDLVLSFFITCSLYCFFLFFNNKNKKCFVLSALFLGIGISTKLIAIDYLVLFLAMLCFLLMKDENHAKLSRANILQFLFMSLLIPLPWFLFSYMHTGNPFYPFFTSIYPVFQNGMTFSIASVWEYFKIFLFASDPVSPLYVIVLPLSFLIYNKHFRKEEKFLFFVILISLVVFYITPRSGGSRFLLQYLPLLSVGAVVIVAKLSSLKNVAVIIKSFYAASVFVLIVSIFYRSIANAKYLPVIIGSKTRSEFLSRQLNFSYGDFYDTDGYFASHITAKDVVLLQGFHNLYYVDFPFIDQSWVKKGDLFNYILVKDGQIPVRFSMMKKKYINTTTHVSLYGEEGTWIEY